MACAIICCAALFGSDLDWTDTDFTKSFNELKNVVGNCLNRTLKMIDRYRGGVLPAAGELQPIDRQLLEHAEKLPAQIAHAYENLELQQACLLPVELARAANGYIDSTEPFKLNKDPAGAGRLDTVLNTAIRAIHASLVGLLPILPTKAAEGLAQLSIQTAGNPYPSFLTIPPRPRRSSRRASRCFPTPRRLQNRGKPCNMARSPIRHG